MLISETRNQTFTSSFFCYLVCLALENSIRVVMVIPNGRPDPKNGIINHRETSLAINVICQWMLGMSSWVWVGQIVWEISALDFIDCINFDHFTVAAERVCSMFCQKWHNLLPLQPFERVRQKSALGTTTFWTSSGLPVCMPPFLLSCHVPYILKRKVDWREEKLEFEQNSWHLENVGKFIIS